MLKKIAVFLVLIGLLTGLCACGGGALSPTPVPAQTPEATAPVQTQAPILTAAPEKPTVPAQTDAPNDEEERPMNAVLTVGGAQFTILLEDSETTRAFMEKLPLTLDMSELNGNEKYNYMPFDLPTAQYAPGRIETGDVMLYGKNCLVIFYESFSSGYSYTRLGRIGDAAGLKAALGSGGVQVSIGIGE